MIAAMASRNTRFPGITLAALVICGALAATAQVPRAKTVIVTNSTLPGGSVPATNAVLPGTVLSGAKIQFATPIYDFGKEHSGTVVKHDFIFTNVGNATLYITNVQSYCGCTVAGEWTREVEPGKTGSIPIEFRTAQLTGGITKAITVSCNDRVLRDQVVQMTGTLWRAIDVNPLFTILTIPAESSSNASSVVRIVNNEEVPLQLSQPTSSNPAFTAEVITNKAGKEFDLVVRANPPAQPNNQQAIINLKTSSTNIPALNITALAIVQPLVVVAPQQITLQGGPLPHALPVTLQLFNNSTNSLVLSEPSINSPEVRLELKEEEPGRKFSLTVAFPAGFEIPAGQRLELKLNSSLAQLPVIKVPVMQLAVRRPPPITRPAPPAERTTRANNPS